jgi:hypothetical protein
MRQLQGEHKQSMVQAHYSIVLGFAQHAMVSIFRGALHGALGGDTGVARAERGVAVKGVAEFGARVVCLLA